MNQRVLDISWETILKLAIALFCIYILFLIRDILVWTVFALIISVLFNPAIDFLQRFMPRVLATFLVYVPIFGVLGILLYFTAPLFAAEIQQFSQNFPRYFEEIAPPLRGLGIEAFESLESFTLTLEGGLTKASANILTAIGAIFGGIFSTITIFTLAIFFSLEEKGIERAITVFIPKKHEAFVLNLWARSQKKVSGWFGARILCSLFVGVMTLAACYILGIKYAISFGFLAGILNIIAIIGPVITAVPIVIFTLADSWTKAVFFLAAFIVIQQIEGNILSPILTKKFIGLPPVLVLIALMVGAKLWGILGAVLAIPLTGILFEFLRDFLKKKKEEKAVVL